MDKRNVGLTARWLQMNPRIPFDGGPTWIPGMKPDQGEYGERLNRVRWQSSIGHRSLRRFHHQINLLLTFFIGQVNALPFSCLSIRTPTFLSWPTPPETVRAALRENFPNWKCFTSTTTWTSYSEEFQPWSSTDADARNDSFCRSRHEVVLRPWKILN